MSLEFRIEQMDAFCVVGIGIHTTNENDRCRTEIPKLWGEIIQQGKIDEIFALSNQSPSGIIGINLYHTDAFDGRKFDYYIASSTDKPIPEGMVEFTVPAATWAAFPCKRNEIADVEIRVFTEWQHTSDYELLNKGYDTGEMKSQASDMEVNELAG
ncbi:MAG: AraC family transcriptional regulator [Epulopiscium sp.]|uniref:AraC family transcriptional regulator n=1 Tax=Defluviitalea raffinosedens TaxID=1450156 RepID=A0A7C8LBT2_9FIRM|nr:effector binding domain-containing protein [Defluviitalea raffinosedens]KAE9627803.1 AraC family transcriptional regulator [Defluviitalea raffinosedens]MBZ4669038.1 AraC family transcriptional regulator [Defluviitaleaceae bacterium]MDK2787955.1 AraC family transcriptional regulator [Candidatus Epulonipiscium sp.]HHW67145.1 AraC family transcriptional regulator [Candidatus Epulonipiscium sp.]